MTTTSRNKSPTPPARVAAGHASLLSTTVYLHVAVDDEGQPGNLFRYA